MGYGMPMGGMGYGMPYQQSMGYGMPYQTPLNNKNPNPGQEDSEEARITNAINECKQYFYNSIWNVDPILFINCLLQGSFEPKSAELENALRITIGNSLWRVQDNTLHMFYNVVSSVCNNEYQKRMNNSDNKQNQQFNPGFQQPMGMPYQQQPMMGGMMGNGMGMGGMPMGMPYQQPMGGMGYGMPMGGMGMPYQQQQMMGGMIPPMNGMGMGGMPYQGMMGGFNPGFQDGANSRNRTATAIWD
jgi:hypothetical protein